MSGLFRLYDPFLLNAGKGVFDLSANTLKLALLTSAYVPQSAGTRTALSHYSPGDTVYSSTYTCYFVAQVGGYADVSEPSWDATVGAQTTDGEVTWVSVGLAPPSAHEVLADVSTYEAVGPGYTAGGQNVSYAFTTSGRRATLTVSDVSWSSASISAKYAVLYASGTFGALTDPLIGYCLLNSSGATQSTTGETFRVEFTNNKVFGLGSF